LKKLPALKQTVKKMHLTASKVYLAQTRFLFHCHIKVKIPQEYGETILNECFDILESIDRNYNSYSLDSYFDRINTGSGSWVTVDENCYKMTEELLFISECTNGAYDITCVPLLKLWGFNKKGSTTVPSENEVAETLKKVDYRSILLQKDQIFIAKDQQLITGSFLKSFAVDKLVEFLRSKGVEEAIINAGGSTIFGLNTNTSMNWKVNIPNPLQSKEKINQILINNKCFCLSAKIHNQLVIKGKSYGHILNSATGYPATTLQTGVTSDNAFVADAVSTALFAVEENQLKETVEKLKTRYSFTYYRIEENGRKTSS
jgi:thiamine biosynthesis lipoprotein